VCCRWQLNANNGSCKVKRAEIGGRGPAIKSDSDTILRSGQAVAHFIHFAKDGSAERRFQSREALYQCAALSTAFIHWRKKFSVFWHQV